MIKKELQCETLLEFYTDLRNVHDAEYSSQYTLVHDEIKMRLEYCDSYTEFGVMQGPTLAVACLAEIKKIRGYDINLRWYNKSKHLFDQYAIDNNVDFKVIQQNSLKCNIDPVDLLYIDSKHRFEHLTAELKRHHQQVNHFIIMHDTTAKPELRNAIANFLHRHPDWIKVAECNDDVGYTTIQRLGGSPSCL